MSKIDDLIRDLCPDGVEYIKLKDISEIGTGSSDRKEAVESGLYPFYVRSAEIFRKNDYEYDEEAILLPGEGRIGEIFHYVNGKYALHQRVYRIHLLDKRLMTKFLLYYMKSEFKNFILTKALNATVTSIRKPMIQEFKVPVPPLVVQREVVRVLDCFAELEAELEARRVQYAYYRDKLLDFTERERLGEPVRWATLGEVAVIDRGKRVTRKQLSSEIGFPVFQNALSPLGYYTDWNYKSDTTFVIGAGAAGAVGFSTGNFWAADDCYPIICSNEVLDRYVFHCLLNQQEYIHSRVRKASIPRLSRKILETMRIPIPPLSEQQRIVDILDRFDALTTSLTDGLPAEIEARRKQYEHYRDKLLTFNQKPINTN